MPAPGEFKLTIESALEIIAVVHEGNRVKPACKERGITYQTFMNFLRRNPALFDQYMAAREDAAYIMAEDIIEIADTDPDPQRARNRIDSRKWMSAKMDPRTFGDRVDLNVAGSIDILAALEAGKQRALLPPRYPADTIDAEIVTSKVLSFNGTSGSEPVKDAEPGTEKQGHGEKDEPNPLD